jgi:hypothetical protein
MERGEESKIEMKPLQLYTQKRASDVPVESYDINRWTTLRSDVLKHWTRHRWGS